MPNPTLSWQVHTPQAIIAAGANVTTAEMFTAIKSAVDAAASGAGLWESADYAAGTVLVLRRKGSPAGELGTARIILFGGSGLPHESSVRGSCVLPAVNQIWGGVVIDPTSGTAPDASYTAGSPYPGKKFTRGVGVYSQDRLTAASAKIVLFDADDVLGIHMYDGTGSFTFYAGRIVDRVSDDTVLWGSAGTGHTKVLATSNADWSLPYNPTLVPLYDEAGSYAAGLTFWDGVTARNGARSVAYGFNLATSNPYAGAISTALGFIVLGDCAQDTYQTQQFIGFLRQIRFGPKASNLQFLRDSSGVLQARYIGPGDGAPGFGMWLDYVQ